ncbi:hypothetical protein DPEC_G00044160 [Dallia pectoralis]|uniref:Uncharacterized protein n=1 Tax=Dallia pectoralis TaxID=75939 RepID=A0ACC2HAJ9_DALPE|nr:hypothetical protein DPEC_G00044160 [Dallia pectoralis]
MGAAGLAQIDSGAARSFINWSLIAVLSLPMCRQGSLMAIRALDDRPVATDSITHVTRSLTLTILGCN